MTAPGAPARRCRAALPARRGPVLVAGLMSALAATAGPAGAEELGRIVARLGDAERVWQTVTVARSGGTAATASLSLGPRLTEIHIQGHPGPAFTTSDVLSMDLRYQGAFDPAKSPLSVDILYMPQGMGGPFWTSSGAATAPVVRVLSLEAWGAYGRVEAVFAGALCYRPKISAATDPEACRELTGHVETELFVNRGAVRSGRTVPGGAGPQTGADRSK